MDSIGHTVQCNMTVEGEVSHTKAQETKPREWFCQVGSSNNGWNIIVPVNVAFSTHTHTVRGDENNGAIGSGEVTIKCDGEVTAK